MKPISTYPAAMAAALHQRWEERDFPSDALPDLQATVSLLDIVYQASLLCEESEPVQCRIIVSSADDFASEVADGGSRLQVLRFSERCELTPHQIRKLASAAGYYRALLAVELNAAGDAFIWGMINTGTEWVNRIETSFPGETMLPSKLVVHCVGPGHLIVASGYARILETSGGRLLTEGFDPFRSQWLSQRFGGVRGDILQSMRGRETDERDDGELSGTKICETFVRDAAQSVVRRTLRLVRTRGHGGMLVYVPETIARSSVLERWLRLRVHFKEDDSTLRFRRLIVRLLSRAREVGTRMGLRSVTYDDYHKMQDSELLRIEEALIEFGHFLADLMSVDGTMVLDQSFRLIGFGGEILGDSHVDIIHRALNVEATASIAERADSSGTRHRSAYRFVSGWPDSIAVVVSQDGDVRFVAQHEGRVTYWPYLP
ncbi:MAG: hypothetical protein R3C05_20750 [Pirellulaceae bacterium]